MIDELNQENQNEIQEKSPPQKNIKVIKKSKSQLLKEESKYIAKILLNFNIYEKNKKLEEMLSDLELFRKEFKENQEKNPLNIETDINSTNTTKALIYNALEKNLIEISYITNKEIRSNRINTLYLWYKKRNQISDDLKKINAKTYKEIDEIDEEFIKNEEQLENEQNKKPNKKKLLKKLNPRNEELINKKMLEDYQRKNLSKSIMENKIKYTRNENISEKSTESGKMAKTISVMPSQDFWKGDFSTFYSYKNGTNLATLRRNNKIGNQDNFMEQVKGGNHENNFFPTFNKKGLYFPPLSKETKFSYSYQRPEYNYNNLVIENNIKENKLKVLSEKRSQEELKEQLDKFGMKRAKYKEDMNNKYELKSVINMYVNSHEFNSPLLEKYKIKDNSQKNKKIIYLSNLHQTMNKPLTNFTIGVSSIKSDKNKNLKENIENNKDIEDFEKMLDENKIDIIPSHGNEEENRNIESSKKNKKLGHSASQKIFPNKKLFRGMIDKINLDEIKNIDKNTKNILDENKLNKIKIKIKLPKEKIQSHFIKVFQKNPEKITSDVINKISSNDSLFKERKTFENLCNINFSTKNQDKSFFDNKSLYSISKDEEESSYHNFCLSMYDPGNLSKIDENNANINKYYGYNNINKNNIKDSKIKFNKLHRTFHLFKDNLLNLRRTMSEWKNDEYMNLLDEIKKNNNKKGAKERNRDKNLRENIFKNNSYGIKNIRIKKQNSLLNAMISPKDEFRYSQYFLPRTGSMLLSRMEELKTNKKKK